MQSSAEYLQIIRTVINKLLLKENVIVGKLIPAGTGIKAYQNVDYDLANQFAEDEPMEALENELME